MSEPFLDSEFIEDKKARIRELEHRLRELTAEHSTTIFRLENEAIALRTEYERLKGELAETNVLIARYKGLATWQPITEGNLPKVGDEVACFDGSDCYVYKMDEWHALFSVEHWTAQRGISHFRPINPPTAFREDETE